VSSECETEGLQPPCSFTRKPITMPQETPFMPYNTSLSAYAKENRKQQTPSEGKVRNLVLKNKNLLWYKFRRQKVIASFILDFYCAPLLLGIEIYGGYHNEQVDYDRMRDTTLQESWIMVIRFTNDDINNNISWVVQKLNSVIEERKQIFQYMK
jgi:very-short-patch-repair endonuclease